MGIMRQMLVFWLPTDKLMLTKCEVLSDDAIDNVFPLILVDIIKNFGLGHVIANVCLDAHSYHNIIAYDHIAR